MMWKRILRDGSILLLLGAVFFVSASAIDRLNASGDGAFSKDRQLADEYFAEHKWDKASFHFQRLAEQDPYNSYAWYYQAVCQFWIRSDYETELQTKTESAAPEDELRNLRDKISEAEERALRYFSEASKFFRHRKRSLVNLAMIRASRQEFAEALKHLEIYVNEGHLLTRSLENIAALGVGGRDKVNQDPSEFPRARLHRFQEFWDLVDKENQIRGVTEAAIHGMINNRAK